MSRYYFIIGKGVQVLTIVTITTSFIFPFQRTHSSTWFNGVITCINYSRLPIFSSCKISFVHGSFLSIDRLIVLPPVSAQFLEKRTTIPDFSNFQGPGRLKGPSNWGLGILVSQVHEKRWLIAAAYMGRSRAARGGWQPLYKLGNLVSRPCTEKRDLSV